MWGYCSDAHSYGLSFLNYTLKCGSQGCRILIKLVSAAARASNRTKNNVKR